MSGNFRKFFLVAASALFIPLLVSFTMKPPTATSGQAGSETVAPVDEAVPESPPAPAAIESSATPDEGPTEEDQQVAAMAATLTSDSIAIEIERQSSFTWPALGLLTSYLGPGHPLGIDIALNHDEDSPIRASGQGKVSFAGGDRCCVYGLHVIVEHDDGLSTLYGHLSEIKVAEGAEVKQGDVLGLGGNTGDSDGKHLHFEVRLNDKVVDPLRYLPSVQALDIKTNDNITCPSVIGVDADSRVKLRLPSAINAGYAIKDVWIGAAPVSAGVPTINAEKVGDDSILLDVPDTPVSRTFGYRLEVILEKDEDRQEVACPVVLKTMTSYPTQARPKSSTTRSGPPPPPTLTPTPTPRIKYVLTPTATPTPRKTAVPTKTPTRR